MDIITLKKINKIYGKGKNQTHALHDVTWTVKKGEFWSIVGPSGSGKSTLLNLLGCMDTPTSGSYILDGIKIDTLTEKKLSIIRNTKVSFVFQQFELLKDYNIYDNIELPLLCRHMSAKERKTIISKYMDYLGISDLARKKPSQISGGQQQRTAIARALVTNADIILADEPTGALDQKTGLELMDLMRKINETGKTIIFVTHNNELAKMTDHCLKIIDGKAEVLCSPVTLTQTPAFPEP